MQFILRGTNPGFENGKYERALIKTAPISKRKSRAAASRDVMAFLNFRSSSLTSIPVAFLYPVPPEPGETAILIEGPFAGFVVDIEKDVLYNGDFAAVVRRSGHRGIYNRESFVKLDLK